MYIYIYIYTVATDATRASASQLERATNPQQRPDHRFSEPCFFLPEVRVRICQPRNGSISRHA